MRRQALRLLTPRIALTGSFAGISVINYAFSLAAGWLLAPGDFGVLAFAQTILLVSGLILNAGFSWALAAELATAAPEDRGALIRWALRANGLLGIGIGGTLLLLFALGPLGRGFETGTTAGIVALTIPLFALSAVSRATAQGEERFGVLAFNQVVEVLVKAASGLALVAVGLHATGAVAGFLLGALAAGAVGAWTIWPSLGSLRGPTRRLSHPVGGMFGALLGIGLLLNLDLVAVKLFLGSNRAAAGHYQAASILANTPYYLVAALIPVLFTRMAKRGSLSAGRDLLGEALSLVALWMIPIEGVLALYPTWALKLLFPAGYGAGAGPLRLLALGNACLVTAVVLSTALQSVRLAHIPARIFSLVTATEAVLLSLLVPRWHSIGASSLFAGASACTVIGLSVVCFRAQDPTTRRHALIWTLRYLGALMAAGGANALATRALLPPPLAVSAAGVVYVTAAVALRLVTIPSLPTAPFAAPMPAVLEE